MSFYNEIAKQKEIERRGWALHGVPRTRQECDAEHTFSMFLLAIELLSKNNLGLDQLKVLKMVLFHELCENDAGDTTPMDKVPKDIKFNNEYACIKRISKSYNMPEIESFWLEYEKQTSPEGAFVEMLDKCDAVLQADIYAKKYCIADKLADFKEYAKKECEQLNKIVSAETLGFYEEVCKLKDIIRRGWLFHNIPETEAESDAGHTFSMLLLACELMAKNNLGLNQLKVLKMVAFHELCEVDAGDTTPMDKVAQTDKFTKEHNCVKRLSKTYKLPELETLWLEYENQTSKEGEFVEFLDRVDAVLQAEIYTKKYNNPEIEKDFKTHYKTIYNKLLKLKR